MGIAELLVGIGKIGKGSLAVRGAKKGEETAAEGTRAAKAKHAQLTAAEPATSLAGRGAAGHRAPWQQARHDGEVTQASERIETARQNLEAARHKLEVARELRDEGLKETSKEVAKGAAKVVAAEGAHLEPAQ